MTERKREEQCLLAETAEKLNVKSSNVARFAINAASIATISE